jgi:flagellar hook-associated protein 3 FlgL
VTELRILGQANGAIGRARSRFSAAAEQITTGQRVERPADDPGAWSEAMASKVRSTFEERYTKAIDRADQRLRASDEALATIGDALSEARALAVQLGNDSYNAADRRAGAEQARQIRARLLAAANTRDADGNSLFAGAATTGAAYDPGGVYLGDGDRREVLAGPGRPIAAALPGTALPADLLGPLDALIAALDAGDGAAIRGTIDRVLGQVDQVAETRAFLGEQGGALLAAKNDREAMRITLEERTQRLAGADPIAAASDLAAAASQLEASRATAQQILELMRLG